MIVIEVLLRAQNVTMTTASVMMAIAAAVTEALRRMVE